MNEFNAIVIGRVREGTMKKAPYKYDTVSIYEYVIDYERSDGREGSMFVTQMNNFPETTPRPLRFRFDLSIFSTPRPTYAPGDHAPSHFGNIRVLNTVPLHSYEEVEYEKKFIKGWYDKRREVLCLFK